MNKYNLILLTTLMGCCSPMLIQNLPGEFTSHAEDSSTSITFKNDGTFFFKQTNLDVIQSCEGKWELKSDDIIVVKCNDETNDVIKALSIGLIESFEKEVNLLNKNKIQIDNLILKRKK